MTRLRTEDIDWLTENNLAHWIQPLEGLIAIYDGIEEVQERAAEHPKAWVAARIREVKDMTTTDPAQRNRHLHQALLDCPLWLFRAEAGGVRWHPFEETLAQFRRRGKVTFWDRGVPDPSAAEIERWIEEQITQR